MFAIEGRRRRPVKAIAQIQRFGNATAERSVILAGQQAISWKVVGW
jgi:hypothetical protein